jgi:ubiquinone/menaquinone biosynthesis C-methylase UbiE
MRRSRAAPADVLDYDAELQLHHKFLRAAYGIHRSDHVVDVGCGVGSTTREAGRLASSGSALGIDISTHLIKRARFEAEVEGLRNVRFEHGDAQVYPLGREQFDVAISRFGTMFFADPTAAFVNIGRSLRATGRLVMLVWQASDRNEWAASIDQALDEVLSPAPPSSESADPFP